MTYTAASHQGLIDRWIFPLRSWWGPKTKLKEGQNYTCLPGGQKHDYKMNGNVAT